MVANKSKLPPRFIRLFICSALFSEWSFWEKMFPAIENYFMNREMGRGGVGVLCQLTHVCNAKILKKKKWRAERGLRYWGERWEGGKAVCAVGVRGLQYWNKMNLRTNWDHDAILDSSTTKKRPNGNVDDSNMWVNIQKQRKLDKELWSVISVSTEMWILLGRGTLTLWRLSGWVINWGGNHFLARISQQRAGIQTQPILASLPVYEKCSLKPLNLAHSVSLSF